MDWNDLRYFLTIARSRSLAKAAHELSVEHTTRERRCQAVERRRVTASVLKQRQLTPAGGSGR